MLVISPLPHDVIEAPVCAAEPRSSVWGVKACTCSQQTPAGLLPPYLRVQRERRAAAGSDKEATLGDSAPSPSSCRTSAGFGPDLQLQAALQHKGDTVSWFRSDILMMHAGLRV
ncbi:hypothetical protein FQA47_004200 [Oryzias melastigma]|uniref:Uncharacterized protein n=1 Tax=Oryzias melastigma TaxID=30732 RepID=A0A834CPM2_ORYME|nr:hypothetical protein FQA47_004200 [Oryzias melastigma]